MKNFKFVMKDNGFWYLMSNVTGALVICKGMKLKEIVNSFLNFKEFFCE